MSDKVSRHDEIIKLFKKYQCDIRYFGFHGISPRDYKPLSIEIEKLFEVEGRVQYIAQYLLKKMWICISSLGHENIDDAKKEKKKYEKRYLKYKFRAIKRTTIDEIIEE